VSARERVDGTVTEPPAADPDPPRRRHRHRAPANRRTLATAASAGLLMALLIAIPFAADRLKQPVVSPSTAAPRAVDPVPPGSGEDGPPDLGSPATAPAASPAPRPSSPARATVAPEPSAVAVAPQRPASFEGIAGEGCPQSAARIGVTAAWYRKDIGGWTGDGCDGSYWAVPMSGDPQRDDQSSVLWSFRTGSVRTGRCAVSVFVPTGNDPRDVAGRPAFYRVEPSGSFAIDQIANRGSWVSAGTFVVRDGRIAVRMLTRGANPDGEHLAAAQLKVSCSAP
jgi:hypothetical protein